MSHYRPIGCLSSPLRNGRRGGLESIRSGLAAGMKTAATRCGAVGTPRNFPGSRTDSPLVAYPVGMDRSISLIHPPSTTCLVRPLHDVLEVPRDSFGDSRSAARDARPITETRLHRATWLNGERLKNPVSEIPATGPQGGKPSFSDQMEELFTDGLARG
jgi:hypothetical protein